MAKSPFHIGRYEAQRLRMRKNLAQMLLKIAYPDATIHFTDNSCLIAKCAEFPKGKTSELYWVEICELVPATAWEKLPLKHRFNALDLLISKEYQTAVPGGQVYQVRFKGRKIEDDEWIFLNVAHSIGRCKLVPTALAARVF